MDFKKEKTSCMEKLQVVYDARRTNDKILEEALVEQKKIKKNMDDICIDLIKDKKIKWIECDLNTWGEYSENDGTPFEPYYIYMSDTDDRRGYFKGVNELSEEDSNHFQEYLNDYLYYGEPNYVDYNSDTCEDSECQISFGSGNSVLSVISS